MRAKVKRIEAEVADGRINARAGGGADRGDVGVNEPERSSNRRSSSSAKADDPVSATRI